MFFDLWLQRRIGNVHPLITLFGVFVGVPFLDLSVLSSALLISIFILLMRIYRVEFIAPEESLSDD